MSYLRHSLFLPDSTTLESHGFGVVSNVPCIFDEHWRYNRIASSYLRERAKGNVDTSFNWASQTKHALAGRRSTKPTPKSLQQIAYRLVNFLDWCEWRRPGRGRGRPPSRLTEAHTKPAWYDITYDDLIEKYQKAMTVGDWGTRPLSPSTVNGRADEACFFLHWAHEMGFRDAFQVDTVVYKSRNNGNRSNSHTEKYSVSRKGRVRANPIDLHMPTAEGVLKWLKCIETEKGQTKALMCRLIEGTGIRREECVQWRIWTLPEDRADWRVSPDGKIVTVTLEYGTKGSKGVNQRGHIVGPARSIGIPIDLADELAHYREFIRFKSRQKYVRGAKSEAELKQRRREDEHRLFLSEWTGLPISAKSLYDAWTSVSWKPYKEWSPHLMRHYWACVTLLHLRKTGILILKNVHGNVYVTSDWIGAEGKSDIDLFIRPQLGHVTAKTSEAYVRWLHGAVNSVAKHEEWINHLEGGLPALSQA